MYLANGRLLYSASDLVRHVACAHLTGLEHRAIRRQIERPLRQDPIYDILAGRGLDHEAQIVEGIRAAGREVVEIAWAGGDVSGLEAAQAATLRAMRAGADAIYQAALFDAPWVGYADLLLRVESPSALGGWSYEVADVKFARHSRPGAILQLCVYADLLARIQGRLPHSIHLILGDGCWRHYRLTDFAAYHRRARRRFLTAIEAGHITAETSTLQAPAHQASAHQASAHQASAHQASAHQAVPQRGDPRHPARRAENATYPHPVEHCGICHWQDVCAAQRRGDDHLSLVAGIRRDQIRKLGRAGVTTVEALAALPAGERIRGIGMRSLEGLCAQATLQIRQRNGGQVVHELLAANEPGMGLGGLPLPSPGDLFFDIEGDPLVEDGGREYLFGLSSIDAEAPEYRAFWAHDRAGERAAFEDLIDAILARRDAYPDFHVYHYAPYEPAALGRLACRHATREAAVDQLLRDGVFVDLYRVVRQALRVSEESYSIKKLEPLYMEPRDDAIVDAGSSIVAYERWLATADQTVLDQIAAYNRADCISTWKLRDWLEARRVEVEAARGEPLPRPSVVPPAEAAPAEPEPSDEQKALRDAERGAEREAAREAARVDRAELIATLLGGVPDDAAARTPEQHGRWLLAHLLEWHHREAKPEWWAYFARREMSDAELIDDAEALGDLKLTGQPRPEKRSIVYEYRFDPAQEHKILPGQSPHDPGTGTSAGVVVAVDNDAGRIALKRGQGKEAPHPRALIPSGPIDTTVLEAALGRLARYVRESGLEDGEPGDSGSSEAHLTSVGTGDTEGGDERAGSARPGEAGPRALRPFQAALDLLLRRPPRCVSDALLADPQDSAGSLARMQPTHPSEAAVATATEAAHAGVSALGRPGASKLVRAGESGLDAIRRIVPCLDDSYLAIQGPPGSGKTYVGAQAILDLVAGGRRVGITAHSHRAISNLLEAVCAHAEARGIEFRAVQKADADAACKASQVTRVGGNREVDTLLQRGAVQVVAGTAWLFARPELAGLLDVLFVDEAGQLSLANTLAVAGAARNLVMLGDPRQLPQPTKGTHPPGAGASALEHVAAGAATIPPTHGILLDVTRRLHPDICAFISEVVYEGRLTAHASCAVQRIGMEQGSGEADAAGDAVGDAVAMLAGSGLRFVPVEHYDNRTVSLEEVEVVERLVRSLLGREWTNQRGEVRPLRPSDIVVVAPYNAQVARLRASLPPGVRVGTVDRFQGQEGAVVVFSMATSSADDLPRDLDFLYSLNRLNVAVSRARGLAVLVCNPALLHVPCRTPEEMALVNALCRLVEHAPGDA
ncbi:MAG: TM0106 family RecB-like putative nuclease [Chloroflexi bacterium]|nr:TM0106 family RecB-like putative nuclease [Chloroflexota bacterium]